MIWGIVGYRLMNLNSDNDYVEPIRIGKISGDTEGKRDYKLLLNYGDPFLKGLNKAQLNTDSSEPKVEKIPAPTVQWEPVVYNGFIQNHKGNAKIGLLEISGTKHLAEKNQKIGEITVGVIRKDSILLTKNGESKWFKSQ